MTTPTATARRPVATTVEAAPVRPVLRVARPVPNESPVRTGSRLLLRPVALATAFIVASLLAVVIGNMLLASGQLQLEQLQTKLAQKESGYAGRLEKFTAALSPSAATNYEEHHGLVQPSLVLPISAVSLTNRLAAPTFSSAPCCTLTAGR
jgi:hypothetical protein